MSSGGLHRAGGGRRAGTRPGGRDQRRGRRQLHRSGQGDRARRSRARPATSRPQLRRDRPALHADHPGRAVRDLPVGRPASGRRSASTTGSASPTALFTYAIGKLVLLQQERRSGEGRGDAASAASSPSSRSPTRPTAPYGAAAVETMKSARRSTTRCSRRSSRATTSPRPSSSSTPAMPSSASSPCRRSSASRAARAGSCRRRSLHADPPGCGAAEDRRRATRRRTAFMTFLQGAGGRGHHREVRLRRWTSQS